MAELLVRVADKQKSGDPYKDRHLSGAGCVIVIMPDGHPWSDAERSSPWRVIKLPGISAALLSQFTSGDLGYGVPENELSNKVLRRWAHKLDLDAIDTLLSDAEMIADMKTRPIRALSRVLALRKALPAIQDPFLLGKPQTLVPIIGKP